MNYASEVLGAAVAVFTLLLPFAIAFMLGMSCERYLREEKKRQLWNKFSALEPPDLVQKRVELEALYEDY